MSVKLTLNLLNLNFLKFKVLLKV